MPHNPFGLTKVRPHADCPLIEVYAIEHAALNQPVREDLIQVA